MIQSVLSNFINSRKNQKGKESSWGISEYEYILSEYEHN